MKTGDERSERDPADETPTGDNGRDDSTRFRSHDEPRERETTSGANPVLGVLPEEDADAATDTGGEEACEQVQAAERS